MRAAALSPEGIEQVITEGIVVMSGLLTPAECEGLAPPPDTEWTVKEPGKGDRTWSLSHEYRFGPQATRVNPNLQLFLEEFRDMVQANAAEAEIPELMHWGKPKSGEYPVELLGLKRIAYGARWHRAAANHQIGWHTDDTHDQARKEVRGEVPQRALGIMVAVSLTELGGSYEYAPANAVLDPETGAPVTSTTIPDISQGDAVAFCTARNMAGDHWPGSFPLHRFVAEGSTPDDPSNLSRDSLVLYYRDVSERTFRDVGFASLARAAVARALGR